MSITLKIAPSETLPAEKFAAIVDRAAAKQQTPEQFVLDAILTALEEEPAAA